ncbi:MAG: chromosome partitioning protein ParB, partial [Gammaproteobacteria bacterium]
VREVEHRVQQLASGKLPTGGRARGKAARARPQADIAALENELGGILGTRVVVAHGRGGKGRLVISYHSLEALDGILARLRGA